MKRSIIVAVMGLAIAAATARAQDDGDSRSGVSHAMRVAIHFYDQGDDLQAMDRFMEILSKGEPAERSMANEYINLITRRMNAPAAAPHSETSRDIEDAAPDRAPESADTAPSPDIKKTPVREPETEPVKSRPAAKEEPPPTPLPRTSSPSVEPVAERPASTPEKSSRPVKIEEMSAADKALMKEEIKVRLRNAQQKSLADLKSVSGARLVVRGDGLPEAFALPATLLFQNGLSFRKDAKRILDPLTRLVFALGDAQILILPEGASTSDANVLDMRRTMGLSSHLVDAGVAPVRVLVNALKSPSDIPKALNGFKGILVLFQYDRAVALKSDAGISDDQGPPMSLGVFPASIDPAKNQGAIIEMSVADSPAGVGSWKYELLTPSGEGSDAAPLQEISGSQAAYHQIFWNGRRNYFGSSLPPGRYECVLSGVDSKGRRRVIRQWIQLTDGSAPPVAPVLDHERPAPVVKAKKTKSKTASAGKKKKSAAPVKGKVSSKKKAGGSSPKNSFELRFGNNTHQMTSDSEESLAQAAKALSAGSRGTLRVVGHARAGEDDAEALAARRAKVVAGVLINRYQIDPNRLEVSSNVGSAGTVELLLPAVN